MEVTNTRKRLKKKKRLELYEGDDGPNISKILKLRIDANNTFDVFITTLNIRYDKLMEVVEDLGFSPSDPYITSVHRIKKNINGLGNKI